MIEGWATCPVSCVGTVHMNDHTRFWTTEEKALQYAKASADKEPWYVFKLVPTHHIHVKKTVIVEPTRVY